MTDTTPLVLWCWLVMLRALVQCDGASWRQTPPMWWLPGTAGTATGVVVIPPLVAVRCSAALAGCQHGGACCGSYDVLYGFRALCCVVRTLRRINVTRYWTGEPVARVTFAAAAN
ncbi:TPA: hypothetical protein ACHGDM_002381 [Escherichia coli]|nr:hypothetical protein [Escherichia coli O146]HBC3045928.1 hypothetical protein [Escherichia coli O146]HBC3192266.1 hypothetical protein [Escherichia coli O146]HBC3216899.1 hypothetical protein [Escherichia coli O146]